MCTDAHILLCLCQAVLKYLLTRGGIRLKQKPIVEFKLQELDMFGTFICFNGVVILFTPLLFT